MRLFGIVLAAGQGTRMKSKTAKVLHPVCGKPMVSHLVDLLKRLEADRTVVVVGHGADAVRDLLKDSVEYAEQPEQLGTGHAVMQAAPLLADEEGATIVLYGDTPCLREESLRKLLALHRDLDAGCTMLSAIFDNPRGYGRIVRGTDGMVERIVEQKDCTAEEDAIREINTGMYVFDNRALFEALKHITNNNAQGEYYLTDVIGVLHAQGRKIAALPLDDIDEAIGVNDRAALAEAERIMRRRINRAHMLNGVTLVDPEHTYIDEGVRIGADTVILPGCRLTGNTVVGEDCVIGPYAELNDATVGDRCEIRQSIVVQSTVGDDVTIGPFAYIRPGSEIGNRVRIGDFVEIKHSRIGEGSKVPHLSYVGDTEMGRNVNIGCGAITANYDGVRKHRTVIEDNAFIGSNVNLIAPVTIHTGAYVVAGSTVTHDVPPEGMAIARARQTNKDGYARILRDRFGKRS
jgi:bifunctional UDP-N-acetylglucosamine pyrophosphorylase/glucosamine-1-phosphate N-acetyltransferase